MGKRIDPRTYILIGIPILFLIGGIFHFLYKISGELLTVGLFVPVNESVFEHIKMSVLPIFLWWTLFYVFRKDDLRADAWFTAALISMLVAIFTIPALFYFYTGALGKESVIIDILLLLAAVGLGQLLGNHYYKYGKGIDYRLALTLMISIIAIFAALTVAPPKLPLYIDKNDGSYGIFR